MRLLNIRTNSNILELNSGKRVLFSYETPVALCTKGQWYKTDEYFSRTTSKHMNAALPSDVITIDSDEFNNMVEDI